MTSTVTLKRTSYIWLLLATIGFIGTVYYTYHFFSTKQRILQRAREYARKDALAASVELSSFIMMLKPVAESLAQELSRTSLSTHEIEALLRDKKVPAIAGLGVAFLPHALGGQTERYAPYLFEQDGQVKLIHLEDLYDYTKPEYHWFHRPLKKGEGFIEPYYGPASKTVLVEYAVPFYRTINGKRQLAGVVYANQNVEHLKHVLDTLFLGKTGYWFILTKKGVFLSHPKTELVHKQRTIFDLAKQLGNKDLATIGQQIAQQQETFFEYDNEITGAPSWLFSEPITGTKWSLVGVFDKEELDIQPMVLRRNIIMPMIFFLLCICMLIMWWVSLGSDDNARNWWAASLVGSLTLAGFVGWVWYASLIYPNYHYHEDHTVENKLGLYEYLNNELPQKRYGMVTQPKVAPKKNIELLGAQETEQQNLSLFERAQGALHTGLYGARFIPTGIYVNTLHFVSANQIEMSAYIWQRFIDGVHDDVPRSPMFPQASALSIKEISRTKQGNAEIILWQVFATLNQFIAFEQYPFDTKALHIQLWHTYSKELVVLVPDLSGYQLINPRSLPGIDDDVYLPGWNLEGTYFGYKTVDYLTNLGNYQVGPFGVYNAVDKSGVPELYFDILVRRELLDTIVSDLIPIAAILFLLFVILLSSVQQGYMAIGFCASVLFATIIAHVRFRDKIPLAQVVYFESFYFILYAMIILVLLVSILYLLDFDIPWIRYRKNMISKLLYWPFFFGSLAMVTLWYLY